MMKYPFLVLVMFSFQLCAGVFSEIPVSISGVDFGIQFEDDELSTNIQRRIAEDIALIRHSWTNCNLTYQHHDIYAGFVSDSRVEGSPYANEALEIPKYFTNSNGTNYLFVAKMLSDAYASSFAFLDENTNMVSSANDFINGLAPNRLDATPSNEVYRLVLYPGKPLSAYAAKRGAIVSQLKEQQYLQPCSLAFFQTQPGTNGFPHGATWMKIPAVHWSDFDKAPVLGFFYAVWHENMWRIYPIEL